LVERLGRRRVLRLADEVWILAVVLMSNSGKQPLIEPIGPQDHLLEVNP